MLKLIRHLCTIILMVCGVVLLWHPDPIIANRGWLVLIFAWVSDLGER